MNYRFELTSPECPDFKCEMVVGAEQTFQQFHDKIVETMKYDPSQMASFYSLDRAGNRVKEISLMDMSDDEEDDEESGEKTETLVMDVTTIREVVNASCIELDYVFDLLGNRYLRVEYVGRGESDGEEVPACLLCVGEKPKQMQFDENEKWGFERPEEKYDEGFMDEYPDGFSEKEGRGDEDDIFGDEGRGDGFDDTVEDGYGEDDGYSSGGGRFESIDDYIDKI